MGLCPWSFTDWSVHTHEQISKDMIICTQPPYYCRAFIMLRGNRTMHTLMYVCLLSICPGGIVAGRRDMDTNPTNALNYFLCVCQLQIAYYLSPFLCPNIVRPLLPAVVTVILSMNIYQGRISFQTYQISINSDFLDVKSPVGAFFNKLESYSGGKSWRPDMGSLSHSPSN